MEQIEELQELRERLIVFVQRKFYSRQYIYDVADDIVNTAFMEVYRNPELQNERLNFGYLSKVCIHCAYKVFRHGDQDHQKAVPFDDCLDCVPASDFVDEILSAEDTATILDSLDVLKQIERAVIIQRYYGDYTFSEIAQQNNIKLNTVLSHHRRALEKLRPQLSKYSEGRQKMTRLPKQSNKGTGFRKFF